MIFDVLDKLEFYSETLPSLKEVGRVMDWGVYEKQDGEYTTNDKNVTYSISSYKTCEKESIFEINKDYVTVSILLEGEELVSFSHRDLANQIESYDKEKDQAFVKGEVFGVSTMVKGRFCLFFPNEPYYFTKSYEESNVKKIVFKIKYES